MKRYFAYIRVSTTKQGEQGSSLQEQKAAVEAYASRHGLTITEWFEEQETAASQGRPVFNRMLKCLDREGASGIITHKIDRSARNLKDWARLGELVDRGIELHFAHESIDLTSRGGRLSADILAVVAADYIRNLRDEVRKGFYGRLKQGIYPLRAPVGYLDQGGGRAKIIDPLRGPLVAKAFELYATGTWSFLTLGEELKRRGLRNRNGNPLSRNGISTMLNNPFYVGLMKVKKTGESFIGVHEPLVPKSTFDAVRAVLNGRTPHRSRGRHYRYQRLIRCAGCGYSLIAERQKGHIYYRCHTAACPVTCLREEHVDEALHAAIGRLQLQEIEWDAVRADIDQHFEVARKDTDSYRRGLELAISALDGRLTALTDAVLDGLINRGEYNVRKERLLHERMRLARQVNDIEGVHAMNRAQAHEFLELAKTLSTLPKTSNDDELRRIVKALTSNFSMREKNVEVAWRKPFERLDRAALGTRCELDRAETRTKEFVKLALEYATKERPGHEKGVSR